MDGCCSREGLGNRRLAGDGEWARAVLERLGLRDLLLLYIARMDVVASSFGCGLSSRAVTKFCSCSTVLTKVQYSRFAREGSMVLAK